ncbi:MAG: hypothetical protein HC904_02160 [Blastochloris sp.]|nr:hypothetical protein [Blastochloris sp.]
MSYNTLTQQLESLAQKLRKNPTRLGGASLAKAASTLTKSLLSFEKKVDALIKGKHPSIEAMTNLLNSPAKKLLKAPDWQKLHRAVFRATPEGQTAAQLQKQFLTLATDRNLAEPACLALEQKIKELSILNRPVPKEKADLQAEFLRLGGLEEESALLELERRWKLTQIKNLAKANAIPVTKTMPRDRLELEILRYARRAHTNISP